MQGVHMASYWYHLSHTTAEANRDVLSIPGVVFRERNLVVPDNAAWLIEQSLARHGIRWSNGVSQPDGDKLTRIEELVPSGLRSWVPAYLTQYQREGILSMSHRSGHFWWAAGSGKTLGGICWSLATPGKTLIVTRASVRRNYAREIERFTEHRAFVIEETKDATDLNDREEMFVVIGWEMLPTCLESIRKWKPINVIFDEAHKAKSHKRWGATPLENGRIKFDPLDNIANAAYRISRTAIRRLATTATPIKDRVRDLWAQLDLVHPDNWGPFYKEDKASFTGRYCAARRGDFGGIDTTGSSNLDELWDRASIVTHHVPHSVTHRHLPPRRRLVTYVTIKEQNAATGFAAVMKKAAKGGHGSLLEAKLMEAAAKKRKLLLELVEEAVASKQKVVIFTGRREDCDKLGEEVRNRFAEEATIFSGHGGTPAGVRDDMQQAYMAAAGPAILVGTGDAWGEGVNLQDTDLMLIAMLPYTPGQIVQWEGRVARHGQKRPVLIQYLVAEGSVDEHVAEILLTKLPAVEDVSHDDSVTGLADQLRGSDDEEAIIDSILSKLGVA
jgi:SNF2 family DNA or RNA helicase